MKLKELQIGDWVKYGRKHLRYSGIFSDFTPLSNEPYRRLRCMFNEYEGLDIPENEIEPIPLTIKMLEENGWEKVANGYRFFTGSDCHFIAPDCHFIAPMEKESRLGKNWFWFTNRNFGDGAVKPHLAFPFVYVHELQQAFRICDLHELAENFKIK